MRPKRAAAVQALAKVSSQPIDEEGDVSEEDVAVSVSEEDDVSVSVSEEDVSEDEQLPKRPEGKRLREKLASPKRTSSPAAASRSRGRPSKRFMRKSSIGLKDLQCWRVEAMGNKWQSIAEKVEYPTHPQINIPELPRKIGGVNKVASEPINVRIGGKSRQITGMGDIDRYHCINLGEGGISAMDFSPTREGEEQFLVVSSYPSKEFKDHWALPIERDSVPSCPILIYQILTQDRLPYVESILKYRVTHQFGLVRYLRWSPYYLGDINLLGLLGLFSDGRVRVWKIHTDDQPCTYSVVEGVALEIGDDDCTITSAEWCPSVPGRIATGTSDGHLLLWQISMNGVECIAGLRPLERPITSIAFHHTNAMLIGLGVYDSPAILIDLCDPHVPIPIQSTLSLIPIVRWSSLNQMWIMGDTEGGVRGLPDASLYQDRSTLPVGTFTAPITDAQSSPCHNITALSSSSGRVHLTLLNSLKLQIYELCILNVTSVDNNNVNIDTKIMEPRPSKGAVSLPDYSIGISALSWSKSPNSPGLLAIGMASIGLLVLFPIDGIL